MSPTQDKGHTPGDGEPLQGSELLYRNVLEHVASGILSIDSGGTITTFNGAAAEICNMSARSVVGHGFFEVFSQEKDADEFIDVIFSAVYDSSTVHQCMVEATLGGRKRALSMATRFLEEVRDGETVRIGVVAMFNDISEIKELRETEIQLARELEAQHAELREAYLDLEETNRKLGQAARKMNVARLVAAVAVPVLFVLMGVYFWNSGSPVAPASDPAPDMASLAPEGSRTQIIEPQRLTSTITLLGSLAPRRVIEVVSPMQGKVAAVHARPGQQVDRGQALVDMDVSEALIRQREAKVAHIKASEQVDKLRDWTNHADVLRMQRAVSKSRLELEFRKSRLEETSFLLERGIIPASEHEAAEREHRNQLLDLRAAEDELQGVLDRGAAELKVARLELDNAHAKLEHIEDILARAKVTAPSAGVILRPKESNLMMAVPGKKESQLAKGASVERGDLLVRIGDLEGLTVVGLVDEVDVSRIRQGYPVRILGDAFPGIVLNGEIERVSSQAVFSDSGSRLPAFEVTAAVQSLTQAQRQLLRLGMSARAEVVVYEKPDALLVPIEAVRFAGEQPHVWIRDRDTGEAREVEVVAGMTTVDSVEILDGLSPGDEILIGGP